ncbi:hypothetical protein DL96DRAFT_1623510 [Flagelloscypha sp. PMI_526]|nr:hypothetical protein DL96DRAFT_1623510 [Flagelloscypha sp. PMI_526]
MAHIPLELVEYIVQLGAQDDETWRNLSLVSHSIQVQADRIRFRHMPLETFKVLFPPIRHAVEEMCSPHASPRMRRWREHVQYFTSPALKNNYTRWIDITLRSCNNIVALSLNMLPRSCLAISIPSLQHLQSNFQEITSEDLSSPIFQSLRSLMPTHITYDSWAIFGGGGLAQMLHLRQLSLGFFVLPIELSNVRTVLDNLSRNIPLAVDLIILSCDAPFRHIPDFDVVIGGDVDKRFVFSLNPPVPSNPSLLNTKVTAWDANNPFWQGKVPEPESFWGVGRTLRYTRDDLKSHSV